MNNLAQIEINSLREALQLLHQQLRLSFLRIEELETDLRDTLDRNEQLQEEVYRLELLVVFPFQEVIDLTTEEDSNSETESEDLMDQLLA